MARNVLALLSGRIIVSAIQFVSLAALAGYLGPGDLGLYLFAVAFASLFRMVPSFGLNPVVSRDIVQTPSVERALVPNVLYLRVILGAIALGLLAIVLSVSGFDDENSSAGLLAGTLLIFTAFDSFAAVLQARLKQAWIVIADSLEAVILLVGIVILGQKGASVSAFLVLYVAANALNGVVVLAIATRFASFDWAPRPAAVIPVVRAAAPLALATLFIALYFRMDILILARLKPEDDVGQYGAAFRFLEAFLVLSPILMSVVSPVFARSVTLGRDVLQRRYARIVHLLSLLVLPVAVAGAISAWRWFPTLPGFAEYEGAGVALAILSPAAGLALVGAAVQGVLISAHLQARVLMISGAGVVLNVGANFALIPSYSYVGAAVATTITEVGVLAWSVTVARRRLGLSWPIARLRRALLPTMLLCIVLAAGFALHPLLQLGLGVAVYAAALLPTGALKREDLAGFALRPGQ